jgi:hypothetical protein
VAWVARRAGAFDKGQRIKNWLNCIPIDAYILTALVWALIIWRGAMYPAFGSEKHLSSSWGGPTLAGAWAVHFAITIGALLVVSLALALAHKALEDRSPTGRTPQNSGGVLGREVAGGFVKGSDMQESRTNLVSLTGSADC